MPGHPIPHRLVKDSAVFYKYQCHHCNFLLREAVQPVCGHWLCQSCADELLTTDTPKCPRPDCQDPLKADSSDEKEYFPDRFVRREIEGLTVSCLYTDKGCDWEDRLSKYEAHLSACSYASEECEYCGDVVTPDQMKEHIRVCLKAIVNCPLADLGCHHSAKMTRSELKEHVFEHGIEHLSVIADVARLLTQEQKKKLSLGGHSTSTVCNNDEDSIAPTYHLRGDVEADGPPLTKGGSSHHVDCQYQSLTRGLQASSRSHTQVQEINTMRPSLYHPENLSEILGKMKFEMEGSLRSELKKKDDEITILRSTITKLEKSVKSKHAEFEDRDFRLSLIENSNHDGSMVWKIPQFSQRMSDAQTGKYTSIFSLPFYTGRYGYKMCLRLYILGDGIGKNTHMSLFFVVMRGEFDNILQWPFTHKVTFKLINQTGGKDVIDTFLPDPMSSSFRKPKSDMNVASGCPRFISHSEMRSAGFIVEDTVFIKCSIDCSNLKNP